MSDIKKLKKLYAEYQKIKGMSDGGKVEHDKHNIKELKISFNKFMDEESKEPKKYSDGGEVDSNSDDTNAGIARSNGVKSITDALGITEPDSAPPAKPTYNDKYAKIRAQNTSNSNGKTSVMDQKTYSDGGEVKPDDKKQPTKQIIPLDGPVKPPAKDDPRYGGTLDLGNTLDNLPNYDDGGQVQPQSNPVLDVIQKMGQAFGSTPAPVQQPTLDDKYANVRQQNAKAMGYADGGEVEEGGNVEPADSDEDSNANPVPDAPEKQTMDLGEIPVMAPKDKEPYDGEDEDATKKSDETSDAQLALEKLDDDKLDELHAHVTAEKDKRDQQKDSEDESEVKEDREPASDSEIKEDTELVDKNEDQSEIKPEQSGLQEQLAQAQEDKKRHLIAEQLTKGGALIGAGIAGHGAQPASTSYMSTAGLADAPITDITQKLALQSHDPQSSMSQVARDYYKSKGINVPPNASYEDISKVAPFYLKDAALKNAIDKVTMQQKGAGDRAQLGADTREDIAAKNRDNVLKAKALENQGRVAAAKASQEQKVAKETRDASVKAETDLNSTRGKQALMMAQKNLLSVKNAQKMLQEFPDTNKWTPQQVQLFNSEIAKIAQGGAPTEGQIHELSSPTGASSMAGLIQRITNVPAGADQGKFIALNKQYLQGLGDVSQQVIKDNVGNTLKSYQDKLNPDAYKNLVYRHSDALSLFTPAQERGISAVMQAKGLSRQDAIKALVQEKAIKDVNY